MIKNLYCEHHTVLTILANFFTNHHIPVDYDVFEHGRLSREKLGKLVFNNEELKTKLESLVHPMILDDIERIFKTYRRNGYADRSF